MGVRLAAERKRRGLVLLGEGKVAKVGQEEEDGEEEQQKKKKEAGQQQVVSLGRAGPLEVAREYLSVEEMAKFNKPKKLRKKKSLRKKVRRPARPPPTRPGRPAMMTD